MLLRDSLRKLTHFGRDESGSFTMFVTMTFSTMLVASGFAWDVIRYEAMRTQVQLAIDNAALAAASLDQTEDAETVANNYLNAVDLPYDVQYTPVAEIDTALEKKVSITAIANLNTYFLKLAGQNVISSDMISTAYEKNAKVEVSLVLDISGSMSSTTKIGSMKTAAAAFVSDMLSGNTPSEPNLVSMSLVPYSTYVNVGEGVFDFVKPAHNYADYESASPDFRGERTYCLRFPSSSTFTSADLPSDAESTYVPFFGYYNWNEWDDSIAPVSEDYQVTTPYCTQSKWSWMTPFSNDVAALTAQINALEATTNTSIDDGVKWGAALLDPSSSGLISNLTNLASDHQQKVDDGFAGRPAAYDDGYQKILVVMTDGLNSTQYTLRTSKDSIGDGSTGAHYNKTTDDLTYDYWTYYNNPDYEELTYPELWSIQTVYDHYRSTGSNYDGWSSYMTSVAGSSVKNSQLASICSAAKTQGILIYTIAYEAGESSAEIMQSCSSGSNYAYTATESNINEIFGNIGTGIKKLQLID